MFTSHRLQKWTAAPRKKIFKNVFWKWLSDKTWYLHYLQDRRSEVWLYGETNDAGHGGERFFVGFYIWYQLGPERIINGVKPHLGGQTDGLPAVDITRCRTTFWGQACEVDILTEEIAIYIIKWLRHFQSVSSGQVDYYTTNTSNFISWTMDIDRSEVV